MRPPLIGISLVWLSVMVLLPLAALVAASTAHGWSGFWDAVTSPEAIAALKFTLLVSAAVAALNAVTGTLIGWVLVRDEFRGKSLVNAMIDLPFALPTIVAGLTLLALYGPKGPAGIDIAFTRWAVLFALLFVTLPFVVRTVQPVLEDLDLEFEEAAASLGATRVQTFLRVMLPMLAPALLTGFALAFARAVGEYGSVIFIAGNIPMVSEITPLIIITKLEQYDYAGATAVAAVMLVISFILLLVINGLQAWTARSNERVR